MVFVIYVILNDKNNFFKDLILKPGQKGNLVKVNVNKKMQAM